MSLYVPTSSDNRWEFNLARGDTGKIVWLSGIVGSGKETAWAGGGLITLSKGFHTTKPFVEGKKWED